MKLFMPKQHGAWAMLIVPFWLGVVASGFVWEHVPFFLGWIFLYLATYPMLLLFKKKKMGFHIKWTVIYIIPALLLLLFPLYERPSIVYFGLMMLPFFAINGYFSSKNKDRHLLNDFSAIFAFSFAGLASAYLPEGIITADAMLIFILSALFFIGSTFFVKTMIREKKNVHFKWISWGYHAAVPAVLAFLGHWLLALAFLPSLGRAIVFYGKKMSPSQIGIAEIVNSVLFFIFVTIHLI
ncbi:hypothetical protein A8F94_16310 [Bacillus sp. FJAT-27225]|uniref:YwiC-like family protein n=1 Tax=Bacillus sp. FJAT-27225 TaxID=1743144 RepID=UPI00080C21BD|nr:YwiC-like family protein [Bacillus sp. FJAT-27225]OCA84276.1 hypothetical protein A8F94_16310 [Bacillus sp. FJAT-27225]